MRKLFLLAAMCCLVMNAWADCQLIGNEIPSGTGVSARSIINIQYDQETHILSFEDIYEPDFTAYERSYQVYFYEYSPDYAFYQNPAGSYNPVFYGDGCNDDAFIPGNNSTSSTNPAAHPWTNKYVNNCAGGVISIDLSEEVPQLTALGYNHVMVGIRPSYKISSSASAVYYSTYGDWHFWLMNTAHFRINPLVDRIEGLVTEVHTPTGVIDNTVSGSPFEALEHVYLCEGQDTAKIHANIFPTSDVTGSVSYFWQSRTDDETAWKMKGSKSSFTKTAWNNAVSAKSRLFANRNFLFSVGDMERVTYFRLALAYDNDTLYSSVIQIDAKSRIKITGPVACKLGDEAWKNINIKGAYPIFDTLTYEVDKSDTIRLKPYNSNWSFAEMYCSIPTGGSITTDSEGNPCITDIWYSCSIAISGETHSVKLYVDGTLYHSFNEVPCSFTIKECNYPAPADPTKSGADFLCWRPRDGSSDAQMSDITDHVVIGDEEWDAVFEISAISLNFIAYPEAGDAVPEKRYTKDAEVIANWISCPADANYTIKSVTFYSADGNSFPEVRFNPNTTYMVQASVVSKAGYTFPVDAKGYPIQSKIIVTNDYGAGTFYALNVWKDNGGSLGFCALFTTGDAPMVGTPTFNHNSSWIKDSQTFTLSCGTEGAAIYYTLDGTVPSATNGTLYTEPFTIDVTPSNVGQEQVIKAIAIKGEESSEVVTKTYNMVFNKRPIYITSVLHGSVSVVNAQSLYTPFDEIELAIAPETGYELESLDVYNTGNISEKVTVTDNKFVMPKFDVRVTAKFKEQTDAAVDQVELAPKAQKVMVDGVLYILRGNNLYNAQGGRVK